MDGEMRFPRGGSMPAATARYIEMMNRVRTAIRDFDPSYRLKARGWICAKEWREICPPPLDYIWGKGYTWAINRINDELKVQVLRKTAKDTITIDHPIEDSKLVRESFDIMRYAMHDIDIIGDMRRQKETLDFMKGVRS